MNVKVLTRHERQFLNDKYTFVLENNKIYVKVNNYNRITAHSLNESINIVSSIRKMTLSKLAISVWSRNYVNKFSLIDVQNAINYLKVSYQEVNDETIDFALKSINKKDAESYV